MEEIQRVEDVQSFPLSESIQLEAPHLSESSPLSEAPTVVDLEASLQCELDTLWHNANEAENFTIFRTPHIISQSKKNLFEPTAVSIGPLYRGQKHLRAMEEQKRRFLRDFLSRGDHISLNLCISAMKLLETKTRMCYSEMFDDLDSNAFVKMMLLDGCFVLEYFLKSSEENWNSIDEVGWNHNFIVRDLLLLENQIPFFIVERLYGIGLNQEIRNHFVNYIVRNVAGYLSHVTGDSIDAFQPEGEIHHLVHLYYEYLVPDPEEPVVLSTKPLFCLPNSINNISSRAIPSATELKLKGLKFRPKSNRENMLDISFEYGVLKIPTLKCDDSTKPIFANLIAFESSKYGKKNRPFTSFVYFLDNLVNTPNDVTILQECGIIENWLSGEEELTHFLNQASSKFDS
ncbi:UPF0481 protein At3g47200-like [Carex rostrata]